MTPITVPVWLDDEEIDGVKMQNTSPLRDDEVVRHIDKIGVERVWKKSNEHIYKKHGTEAKDVIKALNSIVKIAPSKETSAYTNAMSQNGYFMVFDGNELVTAFKPSDKNYFINNSITLKQEIIKRLWI